MFDVRGRKKAVDLVSSELFRVTEMVRCSNCRRTVVECQLPPMRASCMRADKKKSVAIEKTILTEFMCQKCPEHMSLDENAVVGASDAGVCVVCK